MNAATAAAHLRLVPLLLDFGERHVGDESTVWLHSDLHGVLGVAAAVSEADARRAYRRLVREHHPDVPGGSTARFLEIQAAAEAILDGEHPDVFVEPAEGEWWTFAGFREAGAASSSSALAGLTFEVHDLARVPLRATSDEVRVSYGGGAIFLSVRYSNSWAALPVLRAKAIAASEALILTLLCISLIPLLALGLALGTYFLSDDSAPLTWTVAVLVVGGGYGALAWALLTSGRPIPRPRRAVWRIRTAFKERRGIPPKQT